MERCFSSLSRIGQNMQEWLQEPGPCKISKAAWGKMALGGLSIAAFVWKGRSIFSSFRSTSLLTVSMTIGTIAVIVCIARSRFGEREKPPVAEEKREEEGKRLVEKGFEGGLNSSPSTLTPGDAPKDELSPGSQAISSSSSSSTMPSEPLSNIPDDLQLLSVSGISKLMSDWLAQSMMLSLSAPQVSQPFLASDLTLAKFSAEEEMKRAAACEERNDLIEACRHYFNLCQRLTRECGEGLDQHRTIQDTFSHFDRVLLKLIPVEEIQTLKDVEKALSIFGSIYPLRSYVLEREILKKSSGFIKIADQIESCLKLSKSDWKDTLLFIYFYYGPMHHVELCLPTYPAEGKLTDQAKLIWRKAISDFWKSFFKRLSEAQGETLVLDLCFVMKFGSMNAEKNALKTDISIMMNRLSPPLKIRLSTLIALAKNRLLNDDEQSILQACFPKQYNEPSQVS